MVKLRKMMAFVLMLVMTISLFTDVPMTASAENGGSVLMEDVISSISMNDAISEVDTSDMMSSVSSNDMNIMPIITLSEETDTNDDIVVTCEYCGESGEHVIGCFATWTEMDEVGCFVPAETVTLFYNPVTEPDNVKTFAFAELPESFTVQYAFPGNNGIVWYMLDTENWELFADTTEPYSYIQSQYVTIGESTTVTESVNGTSITVQGEIPVDAVLSLESKTVTSDILTEFNILSKDTVIGMFDIKVLMEDGTQWQPEEGKTVDVTIDMASLGVADGAAIKICHKHEDAQVTVSSHVVADGVVTVTVDGFSDFLALFEGAEEIYATAKFNSDTPVVYLNPATGLTDAVSLKDATSIKRVTVDFSIPINDVEYYFVIDDLSAYVNTEAVSADASTDYSLYGYVPVEYVDLDIVISDENSGLTYSEVVVVKDIVDEKLTAAQNTIIDTTGMDAHDMMTSAYDITLFDVDDLTAELQPSQPVKVYIPDAWNPEWGYTRVDVYHILDNEAAIAAAQTAGTLLTTTDADMIAAYQEEAAFMGGTAVPYVVLSTSDDTVQLAENGGIYFETDSFSTFIVNGSGVGVDVTVQNGGGKPGETTTTTYNHTIYMTKGSSATISFGQEAILETTATVGNITSSSGNSANHTITALSSAGEGEAATFTYTWTQRKNGKTTTYTAYIEVIIIDSSEVSKYTYLANGVEHIQIDIEATAIVLGYNNDASTALNLSFTSSTNYTLEKVPDDSGVGYHYQLTYTANDTANTPVTITIRVDETASNLESGLTFADVDFEPTGISIKDGQISFDGYFPVGTKANPIKYSVTVETTMSLTPNNASTAQNVDVSLANTVDYWSAANECPGLGEYKGKGTHTTIVKGSGIDLSKFSTGTVLSDNTTAYVVYSSLTKQVRDYIFGSGSNLANKTYTFTISAKTGSDAVFTPIDTISITVDSTSNPATTSLNTDASKYAQYLELLIDDDDTTTAEFKVEETSYNISGFTCTVELSQLGTDETTYSTLNNGVFEFGQTYNETSKVRIFSITLKCVNTYAEKIAGISVSKVVNDANGNAISGITDKFAVYIQPTVLEREIPAEGDTTPKETLLANSITAFNNATFEYSKNGTKVTVDGATANATLSVADDNDSDSNDYGLITIEICPGETIVVEGLPAGKYCVWEKNDTTNNKYTYDTTVREVTVTDSTVAVTITNIIKNGDLKISKTVGKAYDGDILPESTFEFTVDFNETVSGTTYSYAKYWANGTALTASEDTNATGTIADGGKLTLKGGQYVIIEGVPIGAYTVTETADDDYTTISNGAAGTIVAAQTAEATFVNTYTKHLGDLKISKAVTGAAGFKIPDDTFTFTVDFNETVSGKTYSYTKYRTVDNTILTSGATGTIADGGSLTLKDGQYVIIKDLPLGAYTVNETVNVNYTTTSSGAKGTITAGTATATFTNTVNVAKLTIIKTAGTNTSFETGETFIFHVTGPNDYTMEVVISGEGTAVISGLPYGDYTIIEDTSWSYRYTAQPESQTVTLDTASESVTFTNTSATEQWLTSDAYAENKFAAITTE